MATTIESAFEHDCRITQRVVLTILAELELLEASITDAFKLLEKYHKLKNYSAYREIMGRLVNSFKMVGAVRCYYLARRAAKTLSVSIQWLDSSLDCLIELYQDFILYLEYESHEKSIQGASFLEFIDAAGSIKLKPVK